MKFKQYISEALKVKRLKPKEDIIYGMKVEDLIRLVENVMFEKWTRQGAKFGAGRTQTAWNESWKAVKAEVDKTIEANMREANKKIMDYIPEILTAWFDSRIVR